MSDLDFIPISVATLLPSSTAGLDLYQTEPSTGQFFLYRGAEYPLAAQDLGRLRQRGVERLYISRESHNRYQKYLRQLVTAQADNDRIPMPARVAAMNEVVREVLSRSLISEDEKEAITAARHLGKVITQTVTSSAFAIDDLLRVLHHDFTTFTHSANVAFYAGVLADGLGFSRDDIEQICTGGLLHDIGKLGISEAILCKPGRLDEAEYREIKKHPLIGFRRLALRPELSFGQLMTGYQHHERI
ncbi:MAG: HD-GYP domain-containing protein, partial [Planctomycetaceae bacterium]